MFRHRLRTFMLITGTLLSLLIVAAFVVSAGCWVAISVPATGLRLHVRSGQIVFDIRELPVEWVYVGSVSPWELSQWNRWWKGTGFVCLPLYIVFAAVAVPTFLLWRFRPKPPKPGHCRCRHDLTGNTSGVCPECGVEVQS